VCAFPGDQVGVVRPNVDPAQRRIKFGEPVRKDDQSEKDAQHRHAASKEDGIDERAPR
jgi:hypothetical protein